MTAEAAGASTSGSGSTESAEMTPGEAWKVLESSPNAGIALTIANRHYDQTTNRQHTIPWSEFCEHATKHVRIADKFAGAGFSIATFRPGACTCGVGPSVGADGKERRGCPDFDLGDRDPVGHRTTANVLTITAIGLDLDKGADGGELTVADAAEILGNLRGIGLSSVVYSTHSYAPPVKNSMRAFIQLSRPITSEEWARGIYGEVIRLLGIPSGIGCKPDPRRFWFGPAAPEGAEVFAERIEGEPLNIDEVLAGMPEAVERERAVDLGTPTDEDDYFELARSYWFPTSSVRQDSSGRYCDIECPWWEEHTPGGNDTASVSHTERWGLGFSCFHGHCAGVRGWQEFRDFQMERGMQMLGVDASSVLIETPSEVNASTGPTAPTPQPPGVKPSIGAWSDFAIKESLKCTRSKSGELTPRACGSNIELILECSSEFRGHLRFNSIAKTIELIGGRFSGKSPSDLRVAVSNWIENQWNMFPSVHAVGEQLLYVSRQHAYNPVVEELSAFEWDGYSRIGGTPGCGLLGVNPSWLTTYCGSPNDEHTNRVGAMFLIGAVARAFDPGCKHDCALTLVGNQGVKKSTALKTLAGKYYSDTPLRLGDKDSYMVATATWIVELAEMASLADVEDQHEKHKAFLSSATDTYRPPYGSAIETFGRSSVFAGTVNPGRKYLSDPSGNRRHWSAWVEYVDVPALRRDRPQIWAEAVHRYREGIAHPAGDDRPVHLRWWLNKSEQEMADKANEEHTREDAWTDTIGLWIGRQSVPPGHPGWSTAEIAKGALGIETRDLGKAGRSDEMRVADALKKLGMMRTQNQVVVKGMPRARLWTRPTVTVP